MKLRFRPQAVTDLEEIHDYIAEDNPQKAKEFVSFLPRNVGSSRTILLPVDPDRKSVMIFEVSPFNAMRFCIVSWMTLLKSSVSFTEPAILKRCEQKLATVKGLN